LHTWPGCARRGASGRRRIEATFNPAQWGSLANAVGIAQCCSDCLIGWAAAGADVNATELRGRTPTGLAVQNGHEEIADLLREHGGVE